jgi:hypothetical protein
VRATQADLQSVEETEREKPRRARGSAAVAGIHEKSGLATLSFFIFFARRNPSRITLSVLLRRLAR